MGFDVSLHQRRGREGERTVTGPDEAGVKSVIQQFQQALERRNVAAIEAAVGDCLEDCGYSLSLPKAERSLGMRGRLQRFLYRRYLSGKLWLKQKTLAGRSVNLSVLELEPEPRPRA